MAPGSPPSATSLPPQWTSPDAQQHIEAARIEFQATQDEIRSLHHSLHAAVLRYHYYNQQLGPIHPFTTTALVKATRRSIRLGQLRHALKLLRQLRKQAKSRT